MREMLTLPDLRSEQLHQALIDVREGQERIASLRASLDDANETICRLSAEKAARDRVIQAVKETIGAY
jgi:hypothetical protein